MQDELSFKYDTIVGKIFSCFLIFNILNVAISLINEFAMFADYTAYIFGAIYLVYILLHPRGLARVWKTIIFVECIFVAMYLFGAMVHNNFSFELFSRMYWTILYCIPLGSMFFYVGNPERVINMTKRATYFSTCLALLIFIIYVLNKNLLTNQSYSMGLGYALLYSAIFHIKESKRSWICIVASILDIGILAMYGSRGQLLCVLLFVVLLYFCRHNLLSSKGLFFAILLCLIATVCILFFEEILQWVISVLDGFGIQSRSLGYFLERTTYTGRENVWSGALELISQKWIYGWGIGLNTTIVEGSLPHNIILEFLLHYGVIFGTFISVFVLFIVFRGTFKRNYNISENILVFFTTGFIPLFLSSSYLMWPQFWILLFLCYGRLKNRAILSL
ncbi:MAG: hypothetical protein MJ131_06100 [Lachnospiraceae bacterium]|nr:hypothetical protein [Lachnospiraceae bacterium]